MMLMLEPTAWLRSVTTGTMLGVLCLAAPSAGLRPADDRRNAQRRERASHMF